MARLKRKIDQYLLDWKNDKNKLPLIVKGARQIGKKDSIENFGKNNYKNFNTYKGALYENIVGEMLVKCGYQSYFYKNEKGTIQMDFFIRDTTSLIPIEVKANDNPTTSLNNMINSDNYKDIKYGIKLCNKNIGFNGSFYTFPYFLTFLLKRFLSEKDNNETKN